MDINFIGVSSTENVILRMPTLVFQTDRTSKPTTQYTNIKFNLQTTQTIRL